MNNQNASNPDMTQEDTDIVCFHLGDFLFNFQPSLINAHHADAEIMSGSARAAKANGVVEIQVPQPILTQVRKLNLEPVMLRKQAD
jgi:hypothetical protein